MKKYIITLAAVALAIGGSINFAGCGGPAVDPTAVKGEEPQSTGDGLPEEERKAAADAGFDIGNKNAKEGTEKPGK